jgi:hypothetical protein
MLHDLPIAKPNLHNLADVRAIDEVLQVDQVLETDAGVGPGTGERAFLIPQLLRVDVAEGGLVVVLAGG